MAAIGSIRKHSTILLIVVAVALLAFILGDFSKRRSNTLYDKFLKISKSNISYNEYVTQLEQMKERYRINSGQQTLSQQEDYEVGTALYNQLVDSVLIAEQSDYLGITVTAEELRGAVSGPNAHEYAQTFFSDGTSYNMQLANQFLDNMDQYDSTVRSRYLELEHYIEREIATNKYVNLITQSFYMPTAFVQKEEEENHLTATIDVLQVPYSNELVSDDKIKVTEADIEKWYKENKYRFVQDKEYREVEYVIFKIEPTMTDLQNIENEVMKTYEEFVASERPQDFVNRMPSSRFDSTYFKQGELQPAIDTMLFNAQEGALVPPFVDGDYWTFAKLLNVRMRPDTLSVASFVITTDKNQQITRTKAEYEAKLDSAITAAKTMVDFNAVSEMFSDYPMAQQPDSGRMDLIDGEPATQYMFDSIMKGKVGDVFTFDVPMYGYTLVVKCEGQTTSVRKIQVAIGKKEIVASQESIDNLESQAHTFVNGLVSLADFDKAVVDKNLNKRSFERVEPMTYNLPGMTVNGREIVRWIYDKKTKQGDISNVYALEDMFIVVALKGIYPKGNMSLENEQIRSYAETMAKRDKKATILSDMLTKDMQAGMTLSAIAEKYAVEAQNGIQTSFADYNLSHYGPEQKIIGKLFGQKANHQFVADGEMGVYLIKVTKIDNSSKAVGEEDLSAQKQMMAEQRKMIFNNRVQRSLNTTLQKMVKIEDNRSIAF